MVLRVYWQIKNYFLQLLKGPGLISTSPLNINKRLQRHAQQCWGTEKMERMWCFSEYYPLIELKRRKKVEH